MNGRLVLVAKANAAIKEKGFAEIPLSAFVPLFTDVEQARTYFRGKNLSLVRERSALPEELCVIRPQRKVDLANWARASQENVCNTCKREYLWHPHGNGEEYGFVVLCDGSTVKL